MKYLKSIIVAAFGIILVIPACQKNEQAGTMTIMMTDAPAAYRKVNVEIKQIDVHYEDAKNGNNGWATLVTKSGIYNLLDLRNNVWVTLAQGGNLMPGKINQIRLLLGSQNTLETETGNYRLSIPSGGSSGLKIDVNTSIQSSNNLKIGLDFDAERSIKQNNNYYELHPEIKIKSIEYN